MSSCLKLAGAPLLAIALAITAAPTPAAWAADSAVIMMYHRFGESRYPSTNIRLEQFRAHVEELKSGGYTVLPLPEIVDALRNGRSLPERTIGLSIDDAYTSVYEQAWPILRGAGFPFTLFVATDPIDNGTPGYMSWDQVRELATAGVTIGSQTASHPHMTDNGHDANRNELDSSSARFRAQLGRPPDLFAYPYGETNLSVMRLVRSAGFVAAFGQQSGAIGRRDDPFLLPRFAMNESHGDIDRFKLAANALPLPVIDVTPEDHVVSGDNPPAIGFTLAEPIGGLSRLSCYASHQSGSVRMEQLGDVRVEIRLDAPFPRGRARVNCTMPAGSGRWHWFGRQFVVR